MRYIVLRLEDDQIPDGKKMGDTFDLTVTVTLTEANNVVQVVAIDGKSLSDVAAPTDPNVHGNAEQ